jgi:hypothetical protein
MDILNPKYSTLCSLRQLVHHTKQDINTSGVGRARHQRKENKKAEEVKEKFT